MVTYNGKVGMCCVDWGATHNLGYVNKEDLILEKMKIKYWIAYLRIRKDLSFLKNIKLAKEFNKSKT